MATRWGTLNSVGSGEAFGEEVWTIPASFLRSFLDNLTEFEKSHSTLKSVISRVIGNFSSAWARRVCLFFLQSTVDQKRASHHESNGFAGRIHLLPDLLQQSHSSSTSSTSSSPSSSQPTPTMSPQTPQDKLTTNEVCLAPQLAAFLGFDQHCLVVSLQRRPFPRPSPLPPHLLSSVTYPSPQPQVTCLRSAYKSRNPRSMSLQLASSLFTFL